MRDRVAWGGGCSLYCGSDWDEDLDIFSRPCRAGGGMTGCCVADYTGGVYREQTADRMLMCSLCPNGGTLGGLQELASERKDEGLLCTVASSEYVGV